MKRATVRFVPILLGVALLAGSAYADHYATKADYRIGKITKSETVAPRAGSDDCSAPPRIIGNPFEDGGDTTGATNTVGQIPVSCNGNYDIVPGPDHIYLFSVPDSNSLVFTATTPDDDYDLSIYVISACGDGLTCLTGAAADDCFARNAGANPCGAVSRESFGPVAFAAGDYFFYVDSFYVSPNALGRDSGRYDLRVEGGPLVPVELLSFTVD